MDTAGGRARNGYSDGVTFHQVAEAADENDTQTIRFLLSSADDWTVEAILYLIPPSYWRRIGFNSSGRQIVPRTR